MTERIIDISETPARLSVRYEQLVVEREDEPKETVPLSELAVLVVSNPRVIYTHAVLCGLAAAGGVLITCDERHMPIGMMLPLQAHYVQAERFALQAQAPLPTKKRLWQQIVQAKVRAHGSCLKELRGDDGGLNALASRVRSGDPDNLEARASRLYWTALFDDPAFRRDRDAEDQNRLLNYGYAVLRAIVARAACACGLHPSLGLHHHNRYDAFCLADDLMEPFRPFIDRAVARLIDEDGPHASLDRDTKRALLQALTGRITLAGEERTIFDVAARCASSLAAVFAGERKRLILPEI